MTLSGHQSIPKQKMIVHKVGFQWTLQECHVLAYPEHESSMTVTL